MTSINYEDVNGKVRIELNGKGGQLLHGVCRIAFELKVKMGFDDEEFIEAIKEGIEVCEIEKKLNNDDSINELLNLLNKMMGMDEDD